jgi:nucleotide-binding universal stress UspA family protein
VLAAGAIIAKRRKSAFKVIYVRALPRLLFDLDLVDHRAYKLKAEKQAQKALARRCKQAGVQQQVVESLVAFGKPQQALPRLIRREKPSLLVMGTSARGGAEGFIVGNTSERIISDVPCDVLIIKHRRL